MIPEAITDIIYGPPGTGKTSYLVGPPPGQEAPPSIVEKALGAGVKSWRIGIVAFTKKAASEAMERACTRFNLKPENWPYVRTIHSMSFRQLGLRSGGTMQWQHYRELGQKIGLDLKPKKAVNDDFVGMDTGDRIMFLEGLARGKQVPLETVWADADEIDIGLPLLKHYSECLAAYKKSNALVDYTDMLENFIKSDFAIPDLDVLIGDEMQDLTTLQWRAFEHAAKKAKRVYVAGDDLQAIYQWNGADVDTFLGLKGSRHVLEQSYRIPGLIHKVATSISSRVLQKSEQVYRPRNVPGTVRRYPDPTAVDVSKGTWLILARNGYMLNDLEEMCIRQGLSFTSTNKSPLDSPALAAIISYEQMRKGKTISKAAAQNVLKFISPARLPQSQRTEVAKLGADAEIRLATPESPIWHQQLDKISAHEREYFITARKRGETLTGTPRIRISTIHASKGGEADNVMLLTDISQRTDYEMRRNPDAENRVFYVGVTRAREGLHIIQPQTGTSYSL